MTQPSLTTTFDTSLIDLAADQSFSTTESIHSEKDLPSDSTKPDKQPTVSSALEAASTDGPFFIISKRGQIQKHLLQFLDLLKQSRADSRLQIAIASQAAGAVFKT